MGFACKKCPYFAKEEDKYKKGIIILGFCKLRQKHISDRSIDQPLCKDRATVVL